MSTLPNLNALRVFECAARRQSFSRAADELGVTQSAVSKQVAALEAHYGQPLFHRFHKRVELTAFGSKVASATESGLQHLRERLNAVRSDTPHQIRLVGDADFIQLWLFPRLAAFEHTHPRIRISIDGIVGLNEPPAGDFDCAIVWGRGNWRGFRFEPLLTNAAFPVAAPDFFAGLGRAPTLADITDDDLIHDQTRFWWSAFRTSQAVTEIEPDQGRLYNQSVLCLEAAARGDGVTIGDEVTTRGYLASGRLTCPFDIRLPSSDAYYLMFPPGRKNTGDVDAFLSWMHAEAERHRAWYRQYWRDWTSGEDAGAGG